MGMAKSSTQKERGSAEKGDKNERRDIDKGTDRKRERERAKRKVAAVPFFNIYLCKRNRPAGRFFPRPPPLTRGKLLHLAKKNAVPLTGSILSRRPARLARTHGGYNEQLGHFSSGSSVCRCTCVGCFLLQAAPASSTAVATTPRVALSRRPTSRSATPRISTVSSTRSTGVRKRSSS